MDRCRAVQCAFASCAHSQIDSVDRAPDQSCSSLESSPCSVNFSICSHSHRSVSRSQLQRSPCPVQRRLQKFALILPPPLSPTEDQRQFPRRQRDPISDLEDPLPPVSIALPLLQRVRSLQMFRNRERVIQHDVGDERDGFDERELLAETGSDPTGEGDEAVSGPGVRGRVDESRGTELEWAVPVVRCSALAWNGAGRASGDGRL